MVSTVDVAHINIISKAGFLFTFIAALIHFIIKIFVWLQISLQENKQLLSLLKKESVEMSIMLHYCRRLN